MTGNEKSILWVDPHLEYRSPTMRHLLHALPRLRAEGWQIKAWCLRSDAPRDTVDHVFFPAPKWIGPFELLYFPIATNLYGFWRWLCRKPRPATIIHATCGTYLGANLTSVHFLNGLWARQQLRLGFSDRRDVARYPFYLASAALERLQWWSPALHMALAVSDSVADEVRRRIPARVNVETLANSYDETRFNPSVRNERRSMFREQLGFRATDTVFVFTSFGHYKRKGFWLAVTALSSVRSADRVKNVRLLVVGGIPQAIATLQGQLGKSNPDWNEWITFVGNQASVEDYFAGGDLLIFPSYFETYSLVALEAAAMGLPVLLTPFHGSEMTLCDGVNGCLLSYDPKLMSRQIEEFLTTGLAIFQRGVGRGLTRSEYGEALVAIYRRLATDLPGSQALRSAPKAPAARKEDVQP